MLNVIEYVKSHWQEMAGWLGLWALVATYLNRAIVLPAGAPRWKVALHELFIDLPAFLPRVDMKGLFGLPFNVPYFTLSSTPGGPGVIPPPLPPVAVLVFIGLGLALSACGYCNLPAHKSEARCIAQTDVTAIGKQCAEPGVIKLVTQVLPVVVLDLISQNFGGILTDVLAVLEGKGIADATVVATCAVQVIDGNTSPPSGAALAPDVLVLRTRAQMCLTGGACPWVLK